ncbi:MAG TPA: DNA-binding response regulator, partial [Thiotrichales bacterium]|nr:DNA-binding response regulator [Thiotrichales bacterium]
MQQVLILEDHEDTREWWRDVLPSTFPGTTTLEAATVAEGMR